MTPQDYIAGQLEPVLQSNNPGASADEVALLANELAAYQLNIIIPNLLVDFSTGKISFVVPSS